MNSGMWVGIGLIVLCLGGWLFDSLNEHFDFRLSNYGTGQLWGGLIYLGAIVTAISAGMHYL